MSFEFLIDPAHGPQWAGVLPGRPEPYFLKRGEGEHARLFGDLVTVLLSQDETGGQFGMFTVEGRPGQLVPAHTHHHTHETFSVLEGKVRVFVQKADGDKVSQLLEPGDFGYVPAGIAHSYQIEESAIILGVANGGFERFFQQMGTPTDHATLDQPPFIPDFPRMQAAAQAHDMEFLPEFDWSDAQR